MDRLQRFQASRSRIDDYPCNLIQTYEFQHTLEEQKITLNDETAGYFNPTNKKINFWDLNDRGDEFQAADGASERVFIDQLSETRIDPRVRFM
jgi:hypothetical protein